MNRSWMWVTVLAVSALLATLGFAGVLGPVIRPAVMFWFFLVCPGMAFMPLLNLPNRLAEVILAVALSLALDTVVAEVMAVNGWWSPSAGVFTLIILTLTGAALQVMQNVWHTLRMSQT